MALAAISHYHAATYMQNITVYYHPPICPPQGSIIQERLDRIMQFSPSIPLVFVR